MAARNRADRRLDEIVRGILDLADAGELTLEDEILDRGSILSAMLEADSLGPARWHLSSLVAAGLADFASGDSDFCFTHRQELRDALVQALTH